MTLTRSMVVTALALSLALAASAEPRAARIALVAPQGGSQTARVREMANGLRMAMDEVNQRGGALPGVQVELVVVEPAAADAGNSPSAALAATLAADAGLLAVVDDRTDNVAVMESLPTLAAGDVSVLLPLASETSLTRHDYRSVFRLCPNDEDQAEDSVQFALKTLRKRRVVVVHDGSTRGKAQAAHFKDTLRAKGVREQAFIDLDSPLPESGDPANAAFGKRLQNTGCNLVYYGGGIKGAAWVLQRIKESKLQASFMGGDALFTEELMTLAGDAALGAIVAAPLPALRKVRLKSIKDFMQRYKKTYGASPGLYAAPGYDAGRLLLSALDKAGRTDRAALRQALAASASKGMVQPAAFDANGDNSKRKVHFYVVHRNSDSKRIEFVYRMEN